MEINSHDGWFKVKSPIEKYLETKRNCVERKDFCKNRSYLEIPLKKCMKLKVYGVHTTTFPFRSIESKVKKVK